MRNFISKEVKVDVKLRNARIINNKVCVIKRDNFPDTIAILKNKG